MSENKEIVLDLRFVVMNRIVVHEHLAGVQKSISKVYHAFLETNTGCYADWLKNVMQEDHKLHTASFDALKESLSRFVAYAEKNGKTEQVKPVPRIEKDGNAYFFYYQGSYGVNSEQVTHNLSKHLEGLGCQVYEPQPSAPMFESEWIDETPKLTQKTVLKTYFQHTWTIGVDQLATRIAAHPAAQFAEPSVQIWRFQMRKI